jgi:hypothetical protein
MGLNEWEIILEELTRMGYIVKEEPLVMIMNESSTCHCCYCEISPWRDFVVMYHLHAILL